MPDMYRYNHPREKEENEGLFDVKAFANGGKRIGNHVNNKCFNYFGFTSEKMSG